MGIYPSHLKILVPGHMSDSCSRRNAPFGRVKKKTLTLYCYSLFEYCNAKDDLLKCPQRASFNGVIDFGKGITILFNQCLASKLLNSR